MKRHSKLRFIGYTSVVCVGMSMGLSSFADQPIVRPYQSTRSAGMGGVRITTGLYDENFFNNPARVTANPDSKFTIFQLMPMEVNYNALNAGSQILGGQDALNVISQNAGKNIHYRFQTILPAYYHAAVEDRKTAFAIALITSTQLDANMRQSYQMDIGAISDIGIAATLGRKFMDEDKLSVGVTAHLIYRLASTPDYGLVDYVSGTTPNLNNIGSEGAMADFDLGATYKITRLGEFQLLGGFAIQNLLGGSYTNLPLRLASLTSRPPAQARSYGFGVSATRDAWFIFNNTVFALELTDILNNRNGSFFRMLHLGAETHWKSLAARVGINQGYLTVGFGLDLGFFTLNANTYGEELALNVGKKQDRRYALEVGFHL